MFRNLRNDARYRDRRTVLDAQGKMVTDRGALAALAGGSSFGQKLRQISWLQHEYNSLKTLFAAGLPVPKPFGNGENTILMEYIGDLERPAPSLMETTLSSAQARRGFEILIDAVEKMLAAGFVHADLSAYNVLYWENRPVIIDFPQVIDPRQNPDGWSIFVRDVERLCQYFNRYGIRQNALSLAREIWDRQSREISPLRIEELDIYAD
jgi:RIO kinase 1